MRLQYAKRQSSGITAVPSVNGVNGSKTASDPSATHLVIETRTGLGPSNTDTPDLAPGISLVLSSTLTIQTPSQTPSETASLSGAKSVIPLSAVIGACVGAFIGSTLLICLSIWLYRRSSRRPQPRPRQKQPLAQPRSVNRVASWTRFDDNEDKWDGRNEMSERKGTGGGVLPPERSTSPQSTGRSLTSDGHLGSQHDVASQSLPFAHYHSKLAERVALEPPRHIGVDDQPNTSHDDSTPGTFLSLGAVHIESGKMSPTFNVAKTTPAATASKLHRWESAVVVNPDAHAQEVEVHNDPFSEQSTPTNYSPTGTFDDRRTPHNPFFNAHPGVRSRNPSVVRKSSNMSVSSDPFSKDEVVLTMPKPKFISHTAHDSSSSGGSFGNERSMQNLIAALELPQGVVEERLRVASMQPSEASRYSSVMDSPVEYAVPIFETAGQGNVV